MIWYGAYKEMMREWSSLGLEAKTLDTPGRCSTYQLSYDAQRYILPQDCPLEPRFIIDDVTCDITCLQESHQA